MQPVPGRGPPHRPPADPGRVPPGRVPDTRHARSAATGDRGSRTRSAPRLPGHAPIGRN